MNHLDFTKVRELSDRSNSAIPSRHRLYDILLKVQEENGEFAQAINFPEKCDEHYHREFADTLIAQLDYYLTLRRKDGVGSEQAMAELNKAINEKSAKWESQLDKQGFPK